jgi:aspartate kinase
MLRVLDRYNISFEHIPSGIDTMSLVVSDTKLKEHLEQVLREIQHDCEPQSIEVHSNMALVATVGKGMIRSLGVAARLFGALYEAGVNVRMIDQGSSEMNIIVGVETTTSTPRSSHLPRVCVKIEAIAGLSGRRALF